jgi:hypothetical protein
MGKVVHTILQAVFHGLIDMIDEHIIKMGMFANFKDNALDAGLLDGLPVYIFLPCTDINYLHIFAPFICEVELLGCEVLLFLLSTPVRPVISWKRAHLKQAVLHLLHLPHIKALPPCYISKGGKFVV